MKKATHHVSSFCSLYLFPELCLVLAVFLLACTHPHAAQPPTPPAEGAVAQRDYVDLQPGWRLRVVFAITHSGSYIAVSKEPSEGNDAKVSADFLGYERCYYGVKARDGAGVRIDFIKAQVWEKGRFHSRSKTLVPLLDPVANIGYVRLVYLIRASRADHNTGSGRSARSEDSRCFDCQSHLVSNLRVSLRRICAWVPAGVAVTPEEELVVDDKREWGPAR